MSQLSCMFQLNSVISIEMASILDCVAHHTSVLTTCSTTMTHWYISEAVKEQLVVLSGYLKSSEITCIIHISKQTVSRPCPSTQTRDSICHLYPTRGWPWLLNGLDIAVRFIYLTTICNSKSIWMLKYIENLIEQTCNIFMSELQFELQEARGVHAPSQRIWEALKKWYFPENVWVWVHSWDLLLSFIYPSLGCLESTWKEWRHPCWVSDPRGWEFWARTACFCWWVGLQLQNNKVALCMVSNWDSYLMSWLLCSRKVVSPCS